MLRHRRADACGIDPGLAANGPRCRHHRFHRRVDDYSSFNYETMRLFEEGAPATAFVNLGVTVIGGFMAGWLGLMAARETLGR